MTDPKRNPAYPVTAAYEVKFSGYSETQDASFSFESGLLDHDQAAKLHIFSQHGFTVAEIPEEWLFRLRHEKYDWRIFAVERAMNQVSTRYPDGIGGVNLNSNIAYDKELADRVLNHLHDRVPNSLSNSELKFELKPEPSDRELIKVLSALKQRGEVDGIEHRESTSGQRHLDAMRKVNITPKGIDKVEGNKDGHPSVHHITLGAQGRVNINSNDHSSNVINLNVESDIDKLVTLSKGRPELEQAAQELKEAHPDKALTVEKLGRWVSLASTTGHLFIAAMPHVHAVAEWAKTAF